MWSLRNFKNFSDIVTGGFPYIQTLENINSCRIKPITLASSYTRTPSFNEIILYKVSLQRKRIYNIRLSCFLKSTSHWSQPITSDLPKRNRQFWLLNYKSDNILLRDFSSYFFGFYHILSSFFIIIGTPVRCGFSGRG